MTNADIVLIADLDVSRVNAKLNRITQNTNKQAGQAGRSFSKMSKSCKVLYSEERIVHKFYVLHGDWS